jgi:hypothetical protein
MGSIGNIDMDTVKLVLTGLKLVIDVVLKFA